MKKFTPGPWIAMAMGSEGYNIYTDDFGKPLSEQRFRGAIADVRGGKWKTLTANAYLIAAAPDLYEALISIENDDGSIPSTIWELRNKALNKARGEE